MIPSRYVVMEKKPNELEWNYNYVFYIWWIVRLTHSPLWKLTVFEFLSLSAFSISLLELRGRRLWIELSSLSIQKKQEQTNLKLNALHESNNRAFVQKNSTVLYNFHGVWVIAKLKRNWIFLKYCVIIFKYVHRPPWIQWCMHIIAVTTELFHKNLK